MVRCHLSCGSRNAREGNIGFTRRSKIAGSFYDKQVARKERTFKLGHYPTGIDLLRIPQAEILCSHQDRGLALSTNRLPQARWCPGNGDVSDKSANRALHGDQIRREAQLPLLSIPIFVCREMRLVAGACP